MARVMIAFDGTPLDARLATTAQRLFGETAEYLAVNVQHTHHDGVTDRMYEPLPVGYGGVYPYRVPHLYVSDPDAASQEAVRQARSAAESAHLDPTAVIGGAGEPDEVILRAADQHRIDVIVIGTHDRGWWARLVRPSVSEGVVDDSPIPVLLVRDPD